jgi:hypothetical protein
MPVGRLKHKRFPKVNKKFQFPRNTELFYSYCSHNLRIVLLWSIEGNGRSRESECKENAPTFHTKVVPINLLEKRFFKEFVTVFEVLFFSTLSFAFTSITVLTVFIALCFN